MPITRLISLALAVLTGSAIAQTYPSKPVRIVVTFAAGGAVDILGRTMAQALSDQLGQSFLVENRPGVGGLLALESVAKAAPDGYTLVVGSGGPLTISPALFKERNFDPLNQLDPIIWFTNTKIVLVARSDLPASTTKDLNALSAASPGKLTMASAGSGSVMHLIGEYYQSSTNLNWTHIPYKGSSPAYTDLVAGRVDLMFDALPTALPYLKSGQLKAIWITTKQRSSQLPNVPTLAEQGVAGYDDIGSWSSLMAPKGTPPAIVMRLNQELNRALKTPEMRARLAGMEVDPEGGEPERVTKHVANELARWTRIIERAGIKAN
jgi:tripartite-type tricarboxylate transporter receptor subunit TctC